MDPLEFLCAVRGFFTKADASDAGYDDRAVTRAVRMRVWHRIRRGYYTFMAAWLSMTPEERHLLIAATVLHHLGPTVALSHVTGSLAHGMATWGVPIDRVHVTRLDGGAGRIERDVVHHEGFSGDEDVMGLDGRLVMVPDRCAIETGTQGTSEAAFVTFNSFLHLKKGTHQQLEDRFQLMSHWPRTQHLHIPLRMADAGAQSVGESRGVWLFWRAGLPAPRLQHEVYDLDGVLRGTTDWAWLNQRTLGEFDGKQKYGRLLKPGQEPGEVVFAEKKREDLLRELTGCRMIRLVWSDYDRPRSTVARLEHFLRRPA